MDPLPQEVIDLAHKVRVAVEELANGLEPSWMIVKEDLAGMCAVASRALCTVLRNHGYKAKFVLAQYCFGSHCWVELDGWIIDITATQFGSNYPPVHIVGISSYNNSTSERYRTSERCNPKHVNEDYWGITAPKLYKKWMLELVNNLRR